MKKIIVILTILIVFSTFCVPREMPHISYVEHKMMRVRRVTPKTIYFFDALCTVEYWTNGETTIRCEKKLEEL